MISPADSREDNHQPNEEPPVALVLARYGLVPQVARFGVNSADIVRDLRRGTPLVVATDRGTEVASLLETLRPEITGEGATVTGELVRIACSDDLERHNENRVQAERDFFDWQGRLDEWKLDLQMIDVEYTLDRQQTILYVLNGRNAESTRLALLAAAGGYGIINVQPVTSQGIDTTPSGGCGTGGCGSGGCAH